MTVLTGETGAGKSIMLDALGLALGDRADAAVVRHGAERADIHATFDIGASVDARHSLASRDLAAEGDCLLRRVVTAEGRSRGYINGQPVPLQDLKALGELLIDIHSQHAHQSLLKKPQQRRLLDAFASAEELAERVRQLALRHQQAAEQLEALSGRRDEENARRQLLSYQVEELEQLGLGADELDQLEAEQRQLANGEQILRNSQHALALCKEGEINVINILNQALRSLGELDAKQPALADAEQMLGSALIQVEEASRELQRHLDQFELDPQRLGELEQRLGAVYEIARKHRLPAPQLPALQQQLREELDATAGGDEQIERLSLELAQLRGDYDRAAGELGKRRQQAAAKLQKQVEKQLQALAMSGCRFKVALTARDGALPHAQGGEEIEFLISTNPGSPPQPLGRIASGGELSRISLAIQVVTAQTSAIPTLVFDEVDVGIGGATAEVVGNLLRELGSRGQVLCVTHQPQVASKGHHHFSVTKSAAIKGAATKGAMTGDAGKAAAGKSGGASTVRVSLQRLADAEKIEEIARMLGGIAVTEQSRAHAREMLSFTH
jgi:DNA repair protein RecN (Recombination protein N)